MKRSYLIQRLKKPYKLEGDGLFAKLGQNPFAFRGGMKNGGLSKEAMNIFNEIFRFDYMGAAEYEWGEVPKAFQMIVEQIKDLVPFQIEVKAKVRNGKTGKGTVYVLCNKEYKDEVTRRIKYYAEKGKTAFGQYEADEPVTRDNVLLAETLVGEEWADCCGWLELSNGYMFFTDKEMFEMTRVLF